MVASRKETYVVRRPANDRIRDKFRFYFRRANALVLIVYIIITLMTDSVLRILIMSSVLRCKRQELEVILFETCPTS